MILLFLCFIMFTALLIVLSTVFWIWMLIDCINNRGLADSTKAVWVLLIIFTHFLGAFCYLLIGRKPHPVIVYQYQQPFPQPMMGMYQQSNTPQGGNQLYQVPFQPPYPAGSVHNTPHPSYQQVPLYSPYQPGKAQGEFIPYHDHAAAKPTELLYPSSAAPAQPSYQSGYQPQSLQPDAHARPSAPASWRPEDEPQAIYPELPQQELRQQPNID